ncbi:MAG: Endo-1,4-beta-xylanase A precursor [Pelotomaculum sp. PtaB.Bin104]|nr:MAG: Endo-1,4-beta-xylanase A precursor [Pelotomaculum sp. PtaB.Bin104]
MFKKGFFTLLLTVVLILGLVAASYADQGKGKGNGKTKGMVNWKAVKVTNIQLNDVDSHWAAQPIRTISSYGIIKGYPDRSFRPNSAVSKFEAILMISRAAGFTGTYDSDHDWGRNIPAWMNDCLSFAVDEEILTEDEAENLNGQAAAKRYEVAVWANRAMGLGQDEELSFLDLNEIPYYARCYVGGMNKYGYMIGYPGNFFQPNKSVTRAEMAMVLYRILQADLDLDEDEDEDEDDNTSEDLEINSLQPSDSSDDVAEDTDELVVNFNVSVQAVEDLDSVLDGITVENVTDDEVVDIDEVSISGKKLTIKLNEALEGDKTYRVTIEEDLIEAEDSGENFGGISGSDWEFSTSETFGIVSLTPEDGADDVDSDTSVLKVEFSDDIQVVSGKTLLNAVEVYNVSDNQDVDIDEIEIDGDILTITLEDNLEAGSTYQVNVKADYFEEEDTGVNFEGIAGSDWRFTTED